MDIKWRASPIDKSCPPLDAIYIRATGARQVSALPPLKYRMAVPLITDLPNLIMFDYRRSCQLIIFDFRWRY